MAKYNIGNEDPNEELEPLIDGLDSSKHLPFNGRYRIIPRKGVVYKGKTSWFGQFGIGKWGAGISKYQWRDTGDNGQNASGLDQTVPGIAYMCRSTIKHWFKITFPNGKTFIVRQVDLGPAGWTGKTIDVNAPLAEMAGYSPKTFPTGAIVYFQYFGTNMPVGGSKSYKRTK